MVQQRKASVADPGTHIATAPNPIQNKRALNSDRPGVHTIMFYSERGTNNLQPLVVANFL